MTLFKTLGLSLLVATLAFSNAEAEGKKWEIVRIATEGAYPPFNFTTPDGKIEGLEVDLANDLCARMKVKCEIVAQDWDGIIPALQASKYDAIMADMNITDKRLEVINFSQPYVATPTVWAVSADGPLAGLAGTGAKLNLDKNSDEANKLIEAWRPLLKGKTVGAQVSTVNSAFLEKYFKDTVTIREYKTTEQHDLDFAAGRLDAIFADQSALTATMEKPEFRNMVMVGAGLSGGVLGRGAAVGMRKEDTELKIMFDTAIAGALADGTVKRLSEKWLKLDASP